MISSLVGIDRMNEFFFQAINGPLQERASVLDLDFFRTNTLPSDYDTDLELDWSNLSRIFPLVLFTEISIGCLDLFADQNDFSWETIAQGRTRYYQKQTANHISEQTDKTISLLTSALHIHLNINQNLLINTSSVVMSLQTISNQLLLANQSIELSDNARIRMPPNFQLNSTNNSAITIRVS